MCQESLILILKTLPEAVYQREKRRVIEINKILEKIDKSILNRYNGPLGRNRAENRANENGKDVDIRIIAMHMLLFPDNDNTYIQELQHIQHKFHKLDSSDELVNYLIIMIGIKLHELSDSLPDKKGKKRTRTGGKKKGRIMSKNKSHTLKHKKK